MASNPGGRCCTIGVKHEGEAKGETKKIGESRPDSTPYHLASTMLITLCSLDLLLLPRGQADRKRHPHPPRRHRPRVHQRPAVSPAFQNPIRLLWLTHPLPSIADQFAANGYFVVMPDLFEGDPIPLNRPEDFDIMAWLQKSGPEGKGHGTGQVDPIVEAVIKEMRSNLGVKKIGSVGYCFGAKYVARYLAKGKGIDVGAMAHPSFVEADEIKGMAGPLSIAAAETDAIFPEEKRHETEKLLKEMKIPYQICLYSDVEHGFAVRADMSKREAKFAKEAAFLQHVQWFDEFVKGKRDSAA